MSSYITTPISFKDNCDYQGKETSWKTSQIISISIILIFTFLVLLISIYDHNYLESPSKPALPEKYKNWFNLLIYSFSRKRTTMGIFSVKESDPYKCLDAFKLFIPFYVILGNTFIHNINGKNFRQPGSSASNEVFWGFRRMLYANHLVMDNFMMVAAIILLVKFDRIMLLTKGKFDYFAFIIYRYSKALPIIITCILVALIFEHIGDGPFWSVPSTYFSDSCQKTWYMPFLMINNMLYYVPGFDTLSSIFNNCLPNSWFISTEFHLYILSPIVLIPLYRNPKYGKILILLLFLVSIPIPLFLRLFNKTPALFELFVLPEILRTNQSLTLYLTATWNYIPAYLMGIGIAYLIKNKSKVYLGDRVGEAIITFITLSMTIGVIVWRTDLNSNTYKFEALFGYEKELFLLVQKVFYLSGFCWVIFTCATGRMESLNNILGKKGVRIMSNLHMEMFMLNMFLVLYRVGTVREFLTFNDFNMWTYAVVDFIFTYLWAILASILLIKPMTRLMNGVILKLFIIDLEGIEENDVKLEDNNRMKEIAKDSEPGIILQQYTIDMNNNDNHTHNKNDNNSTL